MKSKTILIALAMLCCAPLVAEAQITTGNPTSKVIRTGNRPEEGNFGLFFGCNIETASPNSFTPMLNMKYFVSDRIEARLGLQLYSDFNNKKGFSQTSVAEFGDCRRDHELMFHPGFAYHFSPKNIIDVYAGAELPFGTTGDYVMDIEKDTKAIVKTTLSKNSFNLGLNAFLGIQMFIADLPVAVSLEYGLGAYCELNTKYKETTQKNNAESIVKYKTNPESSSLFDRLNQNNGIMQDHVRVSISYYFK